MPGALMADNTFFMALCIDGAKNMCYNSVHQIDFAGEKEEYPLRVPRESCPSAERRSERRREKVAFEAAQ